MPLFRPGCRGSALIGTRIVFVARISLKPAPVWGGEKPAAPWRTHHGDLHKKRPAIFTDQITNDRPELRSFY